MLAVATVSAALRAARWAHGTRFAFPGSVTTTAPHSSHSPLRELAVLAATACMVCAPFARESHSDSHSAPAAIDQLVEADPDIASRDLFYGVGGRARAPDPDAAYRF